MERKRRKDSFFGLHFDFHASPAGVAGRKIGDTLRREDIEEICTLIEPDFLQIDCKGHPGYASYPTKAGTAASDFDFDPLALWREVTAEKGVALYMHYSGIWDTCYGTQHPESARINPNGERDTHICHSVFSDYVDKLMIPQIAELIGYGVDGIWVDGDCWASEMEHGSRALDAFFKETGIRLTEEDIGWDKPHYQEYREFCRRAFLAYVKKYTDAAHKTDPDFQVTSNWLYSEQFPRKVEVPLDYLSGDYAPNNSVVGAMASGRILAGQGLPWDLMAWSFRRRMNDRKQVVSATPKEPIQLMQEAAAVHALGGGFQIYITQNSIGTPNMTYIRRMKPVADYCRQRQPFCFKNRILPGVALFNSSYDHGLSVPGEALFGRHNYYDSIWGWSTLLATAGHSYEILEEHNLFDRIREYPIVVCPEMVTDLPEETVTVLTEYAKNGGTLVLGGPKTIERFRIDGVYTVSHGDDIRSRFCIGGEEDECNCPPHEVPMGTPFAFLGGAFTPDDRKKPFASFLSFGKGTLVLLGGDIGLSDYRFHSVQKRLIAESLFRFYTPMAKAENTHLLNVTATERGRKIFIQLVNIGGDHRPESVNSFDEIPPLSDVKITLNLPKALKTVILQPEGIPLPVHTENGGAYVIVPKIGIHEILEIDNG